VGKVVTGPDDGLFWAKVQKTEGCWLWTAARNNGGYGCFADSLGTRWGAHRWAYEHSVGPIPEGLELDHLCRTPACVRPDHLEPVSHSENVRRSTSPMAAEAQRTHCPQGHPYDTANTYVFRGMRYCKVCRKTHAQKWRAKQPRRPAAPRRPSASGAKLSLEIVREIRRRVASGEATQRAEARRCGVSEATVSLIVSGKTWIEQEATRCST
jgi:hypothetical protein